MSVTPKASYFLVHGETGQRYPIKGNVVLGRSQADLVFPRDPKLSSRHCEVVPTPKGLAVRDLNSANGTFINNKPLEPEKGYLLKVGGRLRLGEQEFTLQAVTLTKNLRRRRRNKKRAKRGESYTHVIAMVLAAAGIFFFAWRGFDKSPDVSLSQKQLAEVFEIYQEMQTSIERQTAPPVEIGQRMQGQVLGRLSGISRRWAESQPGETDQAALSAQNHFATALAGHAKNMILWVSTGDNKYLDEIDQFTDQLEAATNEMRALPGNQNFPVLMQSPLQLVEREMRQALRDYRELGNSARNQQVTPKQMGARIREQLIPKMSAAYAKMGAISPQNDFERRKWLAEQKLMTAFIGQLKAMSLVTDSNDPKYAKELAHWTRQLELANVELKAQLGLGRTPAAQPMFKGPEAP